jgi:hypothetical protein
VIARDLVDDPDRARRRRRRAGRGQGGGDLRQRDREHRGEARELEQTGRQRGGHREDRRSDERAASLGAVVRHRRLDTQELRETRTGSA